MALPRPAGHASPAIVDAYATSFFLRYLDGDRAAGRRLDPRVSRSSRVLLVTAKLP